MSQHADLKDYRIGDKIRVKSGQNISLRGIVIGIDGNFVKIESDMGVLRLDVGELTNYSLAARRAWMKMPKKAGRPKLQAQRKKTVGIRIEVDLWDRLAEAVAAGLIVSREKAINEWIRYHTEMMLDDSKNKGT